jgi:50S ribosomal protein L16 3-hydroxylase
MVRFAERVLRGIKWSRADVVGFLGEYLSMPKSHVVFRSRPSRRLAGMVRLDLKTQLLYAGTRFFINGDAFTVGARSAGPLRALADERAAGAASLARAGLGRLISEWQRRGYVSMGKR